MKLSENKIKRICQSVLLISIALFSSCHAANSDSITFDKDQWDQYPEERWKMLDSLKKSNNIVGLKRDEVVELLGENEVLMDNSDMLEYFISPGLGDVEGLLIYFSEDGIAYKYDISVH